MESRRSPQSVQVVSVELDGTYHVNEEAVQQVVNRAEVRGLPVAVVSVAGATRGGKSFLLDFFLRYLHAPEAARANGTWIGADDEPLKGFSWRGGCERDTIGILLWSEPFIVTRENGEKVVVLLMDTQGTFDTQTTFRESSTIFAVSSLLSSVQVYNLSQNIKEDDLEYLQFFAEYGKMARVGEDKPFQVLQFVLRDWSYPYQHPYGSDGGQALLEMRLNDNKCKEELREIRQQIKSNFESVRCFLMAHPGLVVSTSPQFKGCLADISEDFKQGLLELVPSLLDGNNLTEKQINGQSIQTDELVEYLKTYVDVFNSNELPTPVSILKATGEANLEMAVGEARAAYTEAMRRACERCVPRPAVPRLHADALRAAREHFTERRLFVTPARAQERLDDLIQELNLNLPLYVSQNEDKRREAVDACLALYERMTIPICCLTPTELEEHHRTAVEAALEHYDILCHSTEEDSGEDKHALEEKLESQFTFYQLANENKIKEELAEAKTKYERCVCGSTPTDLLCISLARLARRHQRARREASRHFDEAWTVDVQDSPEHADSVHRTDLINWIEHRWYEIDKINAVNNQNAVKTAIQYYNEKMNAYFDDNKCLHPTHLRTEHNMIRISSFTTFDENRSEVDDEFDDDCYKTELEELISVNLSLHKNKNAIQNDEAVDRVHSWYKFRMNISDNFFANAVAVFSNPNFEVLNHARVKQEANQLFLTEYRHRSDDRYPVDLYLNKLNRKIQASFMWSFLQMTGNIAFGALNVGFLGSLIFRRG